jgi:hypothetical protein
MILERLQNGTLLIDPNTCEVRSLSHKGWNTLKEVEGLPGSGYRFVNICSQGKKKKIGVHVLQYMQYLGALIPEGYDVHHLSAPPRPEKKNNALYNLGLEESIENQTKGPQNRGGSDPDETPF